MRKKIIVITTFIVLAFAGLGVYLFVEDGGFSQADIPDNPDKVEYVHGEFVVDPENTEELIGFSDHVFVGKVVKWLGNRQPEEDDFSIPYNDYEVEVLENLKGELKDKAIVHKMGGYNEKNVLILTGETEKKDELPEVGKTYIFIARADEEGKMLVDNAYSQTEVKEKMTDSGTKKEIQKYKKAVRNQIPYKQKESGLENVNSN